MRMSKMVLGVAMVVGLTVLAGCGSSSGAGSSGGVSAAEQPYVDAMMTSLKADKSAPFTTAQGQCLAEGMVKIIGVSGFEKLGIKPADLTGDSVKLTGVDAATAAKVSSLVLDGKCFAFGDVIAAAMTQDTSVSLKAEQGKCLGDALAKDDSFRKAFVQTLLGDTTVDPTKDVDMVKLFAACNISSADLGGS